ncbi:TPA: hypothetical protein ACT5CZ_007213, partial [Burkholderia cenocepacia]
CMAPSMKRPKSRATKVRTVSLTATKFVLLMGVSLIVVAGPRAGEARGRRTTVSTRDHAR